MKESNLKEIESKAIWYLERYATSSQNLRKYLKNQIGSNIKVLIEQVKEKVSIGKSQHFTKIEIPHILNEGSIVNCTVTEVNENISKANLIS